MKRIGLSTTEIFTNWYYVAETDMDNFENPRIRYNPTPNSARAWVRAPL
jgi:hypothetical protein